jgi:hypothetical protein
MTFANKFSPPTVLTVSAIGRKRIFIVQDVTKPNECCSLFQDYHKPVFARGTKSFTASLAYQAQILAICLPWF